MLETWKSLFCRVLVPKQTLKMFQLRLRAHNASAPEPGCQDGPTTAPTLLVQLPDWSGHLGKMGTQELLNSSFSLFHWSDGAAEFIRKEPKNRELSSFANFSSFLFVIPKHRKSMEESYLDFSDVKQAVSPPIKTKAQ